MKDYLVSIIVPIYNVEQYLDDCINSIINQTYKKIEIILIDDGSTDNSRLICNKFYKLDSRIKIITKENGGLSSARNSGILECTGEYIFFVDSDDTIELNTIEKFISYLDGDEDIVAGNGIRINQDNEEYKIIKTNLKGVFTGIEYITKRIKSNTYNPAVWLNLYSSKLIKDNNFLFKEGRLHEDEEWTPKVFIKANKVKYLDSINYNYKIRDNSISNCKNKTKNALHILKTCNELESYFKENVKDINLRTILNSHLAYIYLGAIYLGKLYRNEYRKEYKKIFVIKYARGKKDRIKAALFAINTRLYCKINDMSKGIW